MTTQKIKPKTRSAIRTIPLLDWVANELISRSHLGKHLHRLLAACELPDLHWHDLRHIYASTLKYSHVNMKAVSEFLGHASPAFTEAGVHYAERDCL